MKDDNHVEKKYAEHIAQIVQKIEIKKIEK